MTDSGSFNIREICRGCLSDNRDNLRSIFDSNILETFILCTNVQVTDKDGLPKLICSSCVYKVISWATFKTQCEQSDQILRTTFQCSENKLQPSSSEDQSPLEALQNSVECESVNNLFESNVLLDDTAESQLEYVSDQFTGNNWDGVESVRTDNNEISTTVLDKKQEEADENEQFLEDENNFENIDESDHSSVDLSKQIDKDYKRTATSFSYSQKQLCCDECGKSFRNPDRLKSHQRGEHEGKKPEVCPICQKEFNNLRALRRHRLKHSDLKQFRCDECGKMYKYQTSLTLHKKGHANIRRFVCDLCGKSFVRSHGLQSHLLSHSTLTPFSCDYDSCGKQFKNAIMLRNHQKRHLGIKTFICSHFECGKEFITSAELNTHIRSHTGTKPYACPMCDKSYKTKSHLSVHYRSHSGARPYACDLCPLTFAHNKVLKHHRLVHLGQLPWICDICQRPFRQRSTLMKHKKLHTDGKGQKQQQQTGNSTFVQSIQLSIESLEK